MAAEQMNDSYYRCLEELRTRYKGRGLAGNAKNEAKLLQAEENAARNTAESYVIFDSHSKIGDCYRSGVYNGSKYMTSDDFVRYFKSRREFYMPEALKKKQEEIALSAQTQNKSVRRSSRELNGSDSDSKEGHLSTLISALVRLGKKWLPIEPKGGRREERGFKLPVAAMSGLAVFTLSLGLIVGGSVMIGSASGEVGRLNSEIAVLEATQTDLEGKLDLKYDIYQIEQEAKSLGMIKREHADNKYLAVEGDNEVIVYDENKDMNVGLAALLSAFGIDVD